MITPVQTGKTLFDDIATTQPDAGEVAIWWLGQSGYAIKTASALFYIDLYLSEHLTAKYADTAKPHIRMTEAPLRGGDITNARWVFASHKHSDHLDPGTLPDLFAASPDAQLVLPAPLVEHAVSLGLDRTRLLPALGDETMQVGPLTVHNIPAAHPALDYDPDSGYPFLGYVIEVDGLTLYHSGDTVVYAGFADRLAAFDLDIAFLPINGTSARLLELNVPPNMSAEDAVELAQAVKPRLVIPHHYDMFTFNTVDVSEFTHPAHAAGVPYRVLQGGERFIWQREA
jgi:L-ascorbate metabolism protein UlaG (beta-lactamase superfamily)